MDFLLDLILRFSTVQIQVAFILPTTGTSDEEESSWCVRLRNRSLPVPGGLPGCRSVSTTALTTARYVSLEGSKGFVCCIPDFGGSCTRDERAWLRRVNIESSKARRFDRRGPRARRLEGMVG